MPRTIEKTIYKFDELSDPAKESARNWFRASSGPEDFDFVIDDAIAIGELLGIEFDTRSIRLMDGTTRGEPRIWWQLGYCQSDHAAFEGTYRYRKGAAKLVRDHAPHDTVLHRIVDSLMEAQKPYFYRLIAHCSESRGNQHVECEDRDDACRAIGAEQTYVEDALKDFARWIYTQLRAEDEYRRADEQVDDSIMCNDYEFDEDGRIT
jgi:hypothetical protein